LIAVYSIAQPTEAMTANGASVKNDRDIAASISFETTDHVT
jgi:hypothetical protein